MDSTRITRRMAAAGVRDTELVAPLPAAATRRRRPATRLESEPTAVRPRPNNPGEATSPGEIQDGASDDELPGGVPPSGPASSVYAHLDEKVLQKIVQGRFVALSSLLPAHKSTTKLCYDPESGSLSASTASRRLFNFSEWTDAFIIYSSVHSNAHHCEASALFKYIQTVKRISDREGNFVRYDEAFRCKHKGAPFIPWAEVDSEELGWAVGDPKYHPSGPKSLTGEPPKARQPFFTPRPWRATRQAPSGVGANSLLRCFDFNNSYCKRVACRFQHKCMSCGGPHSSKKCPNRN
jgi:hypothetical protein